MAMYCFESVVDASHYHALPVLSFSIDSPDSVSAIFVQSAYVQAGVMSHASNKPLTSRLNNEKGRNPQHAGTGHDSQSKGLV
ncbi:hypothetical protein SAMN05192539_103047 [Paraburkholderia diazotrophica]|uniref:Uncharacterized protein n=1 Tax=Paraburkholderia diazotrophica TaxID=667676 RepID=A0A1H7DI74_9BURK|nr:hypothetical protein SAMN05192539_103047 [Paraburkholderia diazotrophica]